MKVSVIGAGSMGSGIAQIASTAGCEVTLYDNNPDSLEIAGKKLVKIMNRLVEKEKITQEEPLVLIDEENVKEEPLVLTDEVIEEKKQASKRSFKKR